MKLTNKHRQILTAFADGLIGALIDIESSEIEDYWRGYCVDGKHYDINIHIKRSIIGMEVKADAYNVDWDAKGKWQLTSSDWVTLVTTPIKKGQVK